MLRLLAVLAAGLAAAAALADPQNVRESFGVLKPFEGRAAAGATAPRPPGKRDAERDAAFRILDLDGDGFVSRAEGAGNPEVMQGFDRADRNRDGRLSYREFDALAKRAAALEKAREAREKAREAKAEAQARAKAKSKTGG
ncbi:MAG TPA: EF-hand domain-containing protein [Burkholderiales bacterium]|nr:EF-hand domain-containing protein [Burkholderiales bacterium]